MSRLARVNASLDGPALTRVGFARREGVNASKRTGSWGLLSGHASSTRSTPPCVVWVADLDSGLDPPVIRPIPRGRRHIHGDVSGLAASKCAPLLPSTQAAVCKDHRVHAVRMRPITYLRLCRHLKDSNQTIRPVSFCWLVALLLDSTSPELVMGCIIPA